MKPQPGNGFRWIDRPSGPALICPPVAAIAPHLFTTRSWALGVPSTDSSLRQAAWTQLAREMNVEAAHLARLHQVHGASVVVRREPAAPVTSPPEGDIIVAPSRSVAIAVQTADCVPILLVDAAGGAVAAAHAGWRGLAARVPSVAVRALCEERGIGPEAVIAAIGPAISAARYEVGADVRARFEAAGFTGEQLARWFPAVTRPQHWQFDGWESARAQLEDAGVPPAQIYVAALCTATYPELFCSYRRDGAAAGRMAAAIRLAPDDRRR